jgi:hypothetical protein
MNKEIKYGLKVKGEIFEIKDMMDECPFEGSELAYLADIEKTEDGEFEISIISDNEGYTHSTADFEEYGITDVEVVEL